MTEQKNKHQYMKIERSDISGAYLIPVSEWENIHTELDDNDPGTKITITIVEMTDEEYAAIPEFAGW